MSIQGNIQNHRPFAQVHDSSIAHSASRRIPDRLHQWSWSSSLCFGIPLQNSPGRSPRRRITSSTVRTLDQLGTVEFNRQSVYTVGHHSVVPAAHVNQPGRTRITPKRGSNLNDCPRLHPANPPATSVLVQDWKRQHCREFPACSALSPLQPVDPLGSLRLCCPRILIQHTCSSWPAAQPEGLTGISGLPPAKHSAHHPKRYKEQCQ
jgi:hypothetical protein